MKKKIKQNPEIVKIVKEASKDLQHKKYNGKPVSIPTMKKKTDNKKELSCKFDISTSVQLLERIMALKEEMLQDKKKILVLEDINRKLMRIVVDWKLHV